MASKAIPLLMVGKSELIGRSVIEGLRPEYEVIYFAVLDTARKEVPLLLKGEPPSPPSTTLGSGNWSTRPAAIMFGGAFLDADETDLRALVAQTPGARRIPWLRVDNTKTAAPAGPAYGDEIVARAKALLRKLGDEGKLGAEDDSVYFF